MALLRAPSEPQASDAPLPEPFTTPSTWRVQLIDDEATLEASRSVLQSCCLAALDAEWQPGSGRPAASLVQLACRSPDGSHTVLLLDMQALSETQDTSVLLRQLLQALFRRRTAIKIGFGLPDDLRAIARRLHPAGWGCVAVASPYIDLRYVYQALRQRRVPGIRPAIGPGLAGIVAGQLHQPLDKRMQCSAWHERPLSGPQLRYAAADAACLIQLLVAYMEVIPPTQCPLSTAATELARKGRNTGAETPAGAAQTPDAQPEGTRTAAETSARLLGQFWGLRLEVTDAQATTIGRLPIAGRGDEIHNTAPAALPWHRGGPPRFLADTMCTGLAKQLRAVGVDTNCVRAAKKGQRHVEWRELVEASASQQRVVLTRDRMFCQRRMADLCFYVTGVDKGKQLEEVLKAFELNLGGEDLLSRCPSCNATFQPRALSLEEVPPGTVSARVAQLHSKFWMCTGDCGRVYWKGAQYLRAVDQLTSRLGGMGLPPTAAMRMADSATP